MGASIHALLYRIQWDSGFNAHLVMVCDTPASATGFATLLTLLQSAAQHPPAAGGPGLPSILQNLQAHHEGPRLEMDVSGPPEALEQILPAGSN